MAVRELPGGWNAVLDRIDRYPGDLVVGGVVQSRAGNDQAVVATIRGGHDARTINDCMYVGPTVADSLRISCHPWKKPHILQLLTTGHMFPGGLEFPDTPTARPITAYWLTQGTPWGPIPATPTPRLCVTINWPAPLILAGEYQWDRHPLVNGGPYYPSLEAAVFDILLGRTDIEEPARIAWGNTLNISLAYDTASIGEHAYIPGEGLVVDVRESSPQSLRGHELSLVWRQNPSDTQLFRAIRQPAQGGRVTFPLEAPPLKYWLALAHGGQIIDEVSGSARVVEGGNPPNLPPTALPEAFDFLDSAWRNLFGVPLLHNPAPSDCADLTQEVANQADCSMRLSHFATLLKACDVHDELVPVPGTPLSQDATALRIQRALQVKLKLKRSDPDWLSITSAIDTLLRVNQLRTAFQHHARERGKRDIPTALNRLDIDYPPDWSYAWSRISGRVVLALADLRRVIRAHLPE